ncbi:MAG: hypothetical protein HYY06_10605 [Deltaproteobacteria bacterium]|nr:hypothetical protein [Deltaproteobacteria bacterium]
MRLVARRRKVPADAAERLLECGAISDLTWQLTVAAWRARFGLTDREIYERAARATLLNNPWRPQRRRGRRKPSPSV